MFHFQNGEVGLRGGSCYVVGCVVGVVWMVETYRFENCKEVLDFGLML